MIKRLVYIFCISCLLLIVLIACTKQEENIKIGVFMGVGPATRWDSEKIYMEQCAKELGVEIEVRLSREPDIEVMQKDCKELIDSGIDVLIFVPRSTTKSEVILAYAKERKVSVVNYARRVSSDNIALFVGYDNARIGRRMAQYLTESVYEGDYIILRGDMNDNNAILLYGGAIEHINGLESNIKIILDDFVPNWSPEIAKEMIKKAVFENGNKVDAILAPNDQIAGACAKALEELGITKHVSITGMDTELEAIRRIVAGKQDITVFMNLNELARTAVTEAVHIAKNEVINVNSEYKLENGNIVKANLTSGQIITKENIDKVLIEKGYFTLEQVYGP